MIAGSNGLIKLEKTDYVNAAFYDEAELVGVFNKNIDTISTLIQQINNSFQNIQNALDKKVDANNPVFSGKISGISKAAVGLDNVDNTSDANKPISDAQQAKFNLKANILSPTLSGTPTAPTPELTANNALIANIAFVKDIISGLSADSLKDTWRGTQEQYDALTATQKKLLYLAIIV